MYRIFRVLELTLQFLQGVAAAVGFACCGRVAGSCVGGRTVALRCVGEGDRRES